MRAEAAMSAGSDLPGTLPHTRVWFGFFVVWMTVLALAVLRLFGAYEDGSGLALKAGILALMCFYLSLCNTFLPLPTAWIVLLAASDAYSVLASPWLRIPAVALLATLATVVANLNEYHVLAYFFRARLGARVRRTKLYAWAAERFDRAPLQLLMLVAFIPIPVDVVRWLAILRGYSRLRYAWAYIAGRGARYALFAGCSVVLALTAWEILLIQVGLIAASLVGRGVWQVVRRVRGESSGAAEGSTG